MSATETAFASFREIIGEARKPPKELIANDGQLVQISSDDGLMQWVDGIHSSPMQCPAESPLLTESDVKNPMLWVVRQDDVVWAEERGQFGRRLESGVLKHTNLTGGAPAYSGGELIVLEQQSTIVVNGNSGRYGPRSVAELEAVVMAFAASGFGVWSMGYDEDVNRPLPFVGVKPKWVL